METESNTVTVQAVEIVKRGRGRPKGSKNATRTPAVRTTPTESTASVNMVGVIERKTKVIKEVEIDANLILTKTYSGTPVGIETMVKVGAMVEFIVYPNPKENNKSKSVVKVEDLIRPLSVTVEQAQMLEGVVFWSAPVENKVVVTQ